jgi:hypothetical protein
MAKKIKYIIVLITILSVVMGQLKSDLSQNNAIPQDLSGSDGSILSLFDPSRFSMNHSFSMSMMSIGKQSIGIASYTNNMNFSLRDNLRVQTYLTFMQPNMISTSTQNPYSNSQLYFNTVLDYNPTENTHFQVSFGNYPIYSSRQVSPFLLNRGY